MSNKISTLLGDIVRWIIALMLLPAIIWVMTLLFIYPFEWLLMKTTNWGMIAHVISWVMLGPWIFVTIVFLGGVMSSLLIYLVRQSGVYILLLYLGFFGVIIYGIYAAWSDNIQFSWELLKFSTINRILFTVMIWQLFAIPFAMSQLKREYY